MMTAAEIKQYKDDLYGDPDKRPPRPPWVGSGVPSSLIAVPQWMPWCLTWRVDSGKGQWAKIPLNPNTYRDQTGRMKWAKNNDPTTWATYEAARAAANKAGIRNAASVDGLGFGFTRRPDEEVCEFGLDVDICRDPRTGELTPLARRVVLEFKTFTDISPSDTGLKLFGRGRLPWAKGRKVKLPTGEELELYDHARYFTLTGRLLPGAAPEVADCQPALDALIADFYPPGEPVRKANGKAARPRPELAPDDLRIIELVCRKYAGLWNGDLSRHGDDDSRADLALCNVLAFYCHNDADRMDRLFCQSKLGERAKWRDRADYRAGTIGKATAWCTAFYDPSWRPPTPTLYVSGKPLDESDEPKEPTPGEPDAEPEADGGGAPEGGEAQPPADGPTTAAPQPPGRPKILINELEYEVIKQVYAALQADERLYVRGGKLVSVEFDPPVNGTQTAPKIVTLETAEVRTRITRYARLLRENDKGEMKPCHPPDWLAKGVCAATVKGNLRYLAAVSTSPVLRMDGTVHQCPGYDPATGVLYVADADCDTIPENPTRDDAARAAETILKGVRQFPWRATIDQSAWLSMVLTAACRHSFHGPAPLFVGIANHPRAGKTALTKAAGMIATGREALFEGYPVRRVAGGKKDTEDNEELRKLKTAVLAAGHPFYCLDNVPNGHRFGSHVLDSLVTSVMDAGRLTGTGDASARPALTTWTINGNNIAPVGDTVHRVVPWRQSIRDAREHKQKGFEGLEVTEWASKHRAELYAGCLTMVGAYIRAGRPDQQLPNFAGFEAWSQTIRSAIVWAGLPDPLLTQHEFTATGEDETEAGHLIDLLFELESGRGPLTCAEILDLLDDDLDAGPAGSWKHPAALIAFRFVFPKGKPSAKKFGAVMKSHRGRVVRDWCIGGKPDRNGVVQWTVQSTVPHFTHGSEEQQGEGEHQKCGVTPPVTPQDPAPDPAPQPDNPPTGYDLLRGLRGENLRVRTHEASPPDTTHTEGSPYKEPPSADPANPATTPNNHAGQGDKVRGQSAGDAGSAGSPPDHDPDGTFEITESIE
ncbi:MAG TPA: hypothetical protein VD866_26270 [Urbifossiella sp.]|nr:hypothetical protein [Urbifossiella sp.]